MNVCMKYHKLKNFFINLNLILFSTLFIYLIFELIFFRFFLHWLPLKTHWFIKNPTRILAQSSKKATIPKNYIALVGDSHAQGLGDWMLSVNQFLNPDHYSGDIVHNKIGQDVVSFGRKGSNIIDIAITPINAYNYINKVFMLKIDPPEEMIVYLYEGNDFNDTIRHVERLLHEDLTYDPISFKQILDKRTSQMGHTQLSLKDHALFLNFLETMIKDFNNDYFRNWGWDSYGTKILLAGKEVIIPNSLQSPALELTDDEIDFGIYAFEQCLLYLRDYFPNTLISVVYLPSPLSVYEIVSEYVAIETSSDGNNIYPQENVRRRSDDIYQKIEKMLERNNFKHIDARPLLREAAKNKLLHGPKDWWHLNKDGQFVLAEVVLNLIAKEK